MREIPAKLLEILRAPRFADRVSAACLNKATDLDTAKVNRFHPFATVRREGDVWWIDRFRTNCFLIPAVGIFFATVTGVFSGFLKGHAVGLVAGFSVGVGIISLMGWLVMRSPESRLLSVTKGTRWVLDGANWNLDEFIGFVVVNVSSEVWGKRSDYSCIIGVSSSGRISPLAIGASVLLMRILMRQGYCVLDARGDVSHPVVRPEWA